MTKNDHSPKNTSQNTVLLLIRNTTDRRLLRKFIEASGYTVKIGFKSVAGEWIESSLIISDEQNAKKFARDILVIKKQSAPLFLPTIILLPEQKNSIPWLKAGFDEALKLPLIKTEFLSKLDVFLRLRTQSEMQYQLIFEHINIGIYRLSSQNRIVLANLNFAKILGYKTTEEVINKSLEELGLTFDSERKNGVEQLQHIRKTDGYESLWTRKDNTTIYVKENAIVFKNGDNQEHYYASTIEDITQKKLAEQALKLSEEKHRQLIEYLPYGFLILLDDTISFVNKAMRTILHVVDPSQLIGERFLDRIPSNQQDAFKKHIILIKDKKQAPYSWQQRLLALDGQLIDVELLACPTMYEGSLSIQLIIHDISARVIAEKKINYMAYHDSLTGLINRSKLEIVTNQILKFAKWYKRHVLVVFMDLNRFKTVNDALGHSFGDVLLCELANRLKKTFRPADVIARIGGDEFVIVIADIDDVATATQMFIEKIRHSLAEPFMLSPHKFHITASLGMSIYPRDGEDGATLIKNADIAMYYAKESGGNSFKLYNQVMAIDEQQKVSLEEKIRDALINNELFVCYQPKIITQSGKMSGAEALIRWQHPIDGYIEPSIFIPLAEETGLIIPITKMVFTQVCQQIQNWQKRNIPPIDIAINLSARIFTNTGFIDDVISILKQYEINPHLITIEITESILVQDVENNINSIHKLKKTGLKISIDDFGTGYSSLNYLRYLTIDSLKIDLTFVKYITTDLDDALIIKTIISMAHNLNIKVIAEGVETKEQLELLKEYQCDEVQGFYFSKAVPADELIKFLSKNG
ncbi:MAG: EAL domain-containing protein [Legionellaceae bacterium]|nr:EAL domain-containing protein [Legionellaceae bacterium]